MIQRDGVKLSLTDFSTWVHGVLAWAAQPMTVIEIDCSVYIETILTYFHLGLS